jgi:hypothetical protein
MIWLGGGCGTVALCEAYPEYCQAAGDTSTESGSTESGSTESGSTTETGDAETLPEIPSMFELELAPIKQFVFSWAPAAGADYYQLLESVAPGEPFVQVDEDIVGLTTALTVPLHLRVNASYQLRACNNTGCTDSAVVEVTGTLVEAIGYFKASHAEQNDWFGQSVALSSDGTTLAVGADGDDSSAAGIDGDANDNSLDRAGAVHVFIRDEQNTWSKQAYIKASNPDMYDRFGQSTVLSADGNTLAVSAPYESSNADGINESQSDDTAPEAGAVYVFVRDGRGDWSQQAYVKASNSDAGDWFGETLALAEDGNTLAVGARAEASVATGIGGPEISNSAAHAGAVYLFVRNGSTWSQQAYIKASNTDADDQFGFDVALSADGDTLAVGALSEASNAIGIDGDQSNDSAPAAGAVYVFVRGGVAWSQQAYIKGSNTEMGDSFGGSVALSADGNTLAVSAYNEASGAVGVDADQNDNSVPEAGAVFVFVRDGLTWSQQVYIKASYSLEMYHYFGMDVVLSGDGDTLIVNARSKSGAIGLGGDPADTSAPNSGEVFVFVRENLEWSQETYVKGPTTNYNDLFTGVALSADGNTLAIGTTGEASNATGIGGNPNDNSVSSAGAVYLY